MIDILIEITRTLGYLIIFVGRKIAEGAVFVFEEVIKVFKNASISSVFKKRKPKRKKAISKKKKPKKNGSTGSPLKKILLKLKRIITDFKKWLSQKVKDFRARIKAKKKKVKKPKPKKPVKNTSTSSVFKKRKPKQKKTVIQKLKTVRVFILGIIFSLIFIYTPLEMYFWFRELPSADLLMVEANQKSTKIYDRNGVLLYEIYIDKNYSPVKLDQIPEYVIEATLAAEDDQFYEHTGIRLDAIVRAARNMIFGGELQSGSTITQQLVKNVLLTPERTYSRKIKEIILSVLVEAKYSKDELLEMYLNNIAYGGTAWGIESAANKYFGKSVWELSLAEAALLAGLPSSPTVNSPLTNPDLAKGRQKYVLDRMYILGYINETERDIALSDTLLFASQDDYIRAPHFVNYVRSELEKAYGKRQVEMGGLTVTTTLDIDLQDKIQQIVKEEVDNSAYLGFSNGAVVVLDPKTSEIIAYVGSKDYFEPGWGAFDVASAYRQPGSSVKPITYALALSSGYTPATVIEDEAILFKIPGSTPYKPVNYDGKYHGKVTLRTALANSYNIPAVKLAHQVGPDNIVRLGKDMGLTNWEADGSYGLSITLGGKEVRLLDHTNVFATFARQGTYKPTTPFLSVKDNRGYDIYGGNGSEERVISEEVSYLIWDILSDNNARTPAFGSRSYLNVAGHRVAVKTGTTDDIKDNWTMGYTPSYVVGVWVGNNDNSPMYRGIASGLTGASPIWNKVMTTVLEDTENEDYDRPEGVFVKYDEECGRSEVFIKGSNIPKDLCVKEKDEEDKDKDD